MVRTKSRYLVLLVRTKDGRVHDSIGPALQAAISSSLARRYGDTASEAAAASLAAPFYHHVAGVAIVRCARSEHVKVVQSCLQLTLVDCKNVSVKLLKLTGALRVARREAAEHIQTLMEGRTLTPQQVTAVKALEDKLTSLY